MLTATEMVKSSRARNGVRLTSLAFTPAEWTLLDAMAAHYGGKKAAVVAGLRALEGRADLTDVELVELLSRRLQLR
jgi:hypothetical protein